MKRPNGSGSVVKLSGKRRKPYAIYITDGVLISPEGKVRQIRKCVGYFEKRTDALNELGKYNTSPTEFIQLKPTKKKETFEDVHRLFLDDLEKRPKKLGKSMMQGYAAAYKKFEPLHKMVFEQITVRDYEDIAGQYQNMSPSTMKYMKFLISQMYKTAMRYQIVEKDLSDLLIFHATNENARPHETFTENEIDVLWANKSDFEARLLLILIYTGMRVRELLYMRSEDVHIGARYMVGGLKTDAGKNRMIPISDKILPFIDTSHEYLITYHGEALDYDAAYKLLKKYYESIRMYEHDFHDTRHTCATLMEKAGIIKEHRKLILGHASGDVTDRYTHVAIEDLVKDINKI